MIQLTWIHGFYLFFVFLVVTSMIYRKDTAILCTIGIFLLGILATGSFFSAVSAIFKVFFYTSHQLLSLILVISVIVAMTHVLQKSGVNETLVTPFTKLIRGPRLGFWIIGLTIFCFSLFFWPSPAVALIGAFLLPAAMRVGISPLTVAISMNLFGHGIALSGDYVIQGTPKLTAKAANITIAEVIKASVPLVIVMGVVTTVIAFLFLQRAIKLGNITETTGRLEANLSADIPTRLQPISNKLRNILAILVVSLFLTNILAMFFYDLQGDEASALIMGTSMLTLIVINLVTDYKQAIQDTTHYLIEGFQFAFKIFTPVIPIASFFYLGGSLFFEIFGKILPIGSHGLIYDLGAAVSQSVAVIPEIGILLITGIGIISGLDGSGYSGISLIGQISHLFANKPQDIATLSAWGQIVSIWIGGGTIVPWALLPAAAICRVDPIEVARRNLFPVFIGLGITSLVAICILRLS